jgi:hypothetical protein
VEVARDLNNMLKSFKLMAALEEELKPFILDIDQALLIEGRERSEEEGFHAVTAPGLEPLIGDDKTALAEHDIPATSVPRKGVDQGAVAIEEQCMHALGRQEVRWNLAKTQFRVHVQGYFL